MGWVPLNSVWLWVSLSLCLSLVIFATKQWRDKAKARKQGLFSSANIIATSGSGGLTRLMIGNHADW